MAKTVWVVQGEAGCYSDYTCWVVAACDTEELAEEYARLARSWIVNKAFELRSMLPRASQPRRRELMSQNPYDLLCPEDAEYSVVEVLMHEGKVIDVKV